MCVMLPSVTHNQFNYMVLRAEGILLRGEGWHDGGPFESGYKPNLFTKLWFYILGHEP